MLPDILNFLLAGVKGRVAFGGLTHLPFQFGIVNTNPSGFYSTKFLQGPSETITLLGCHLQITQEDALTNIQILSDLNGLEFDVRNNGISILSMRNSTGLNQGLLLNRILNRTYNLPDYTASAGEDGSLRFSATGFIPLMARSGPGGALEIGVEKIFGIGGIPRFYHMGGVCYAVANDE